MKCFGSNASPISSDFHVGIRATITSVFARQSLNHTQHIVVLRRPHFIALALLTVGAGLVVHYRGDLLGNDGRDIMGDALWAMMMAWWVGALTPQSSTITRGVAALAISFCVEFSQLIQTPALDSLRASTLGHLVLGSGFDTRDLVSYTCGVVAATVIERAIRNRQR